MVLKAGAVPRLFDEPDVPVEKVAAASHRGGNEKGWRGRRLEKDGPQGLIYVPHVRKS